MQKGPGLKVVIVCGYGCHLTTELRHYLDRVVAYLKQERPSLLILCGGPTQQASARGVTEAGLMQSYLNPRLDYDPVWLLEQESFTTPDNISGARRRLEEMEILPEECDMTIFCEATRGLKVAGIARRYFGFPPEQERGPIRIETDSWELMHPIKELWGTCKDFLALYVPGLNALHAWQRRRRAKRI